MKVKRGVATAPYRIKNGKREYVLLRRNKNWKGWEMPKGHLEEKDYDHTVQIELKEEAGIEKEEILEKEPLQEKEGSHKSISWTYQKNGEKIRSEFLAFKVRLSSDTELDISDNPHSEHTDARFVKYKEALELLTHEEQKEILKLTHRKKNEKTDFK